MTVYRVLRNLTGVTVSMGSFVKYHAFWYQANTYKNESIICLAAVLYSAASIMVLSHISPIILDIIAPLNESRPITYPVDVELLFDQDSHPILISVIYILWLAMIGAIYIGTESSTIMIGLHVASLFEITSYYFQKAVAIEVTDSFISRKYTNNKNVSYLIRSVIMHRETIKFCDECDAYFKLSYTPLIILGVTSLSINLFVLSQSAINSTNVEEILFYFLLIVGEVQYMFLMNFAVQYIMDGSENISITMYMS
nr:PREDICTED: uncharacterized protein LOC105663457 [Megachile rotundata]